MPHGTASSTNDGAHAGAAPTSRLDHLQAAIDAATPHIDDALLNEVLALTNDVQGVSWMSGRPENNGEPAAS